MSYGKQIDRRHPGCLVLLLDQSGSMREPIANGGGRSKSEALAEVVNGLLYELVLRCIKNPSEGPRHYYDLAVVGYGGDQVGSVLGGELQGRDVVSIVELANHPLRVEERTEGTPEIDLGGDQPTLPRATRMPVWVDAAAAGGTPMGEALNRSGAILAPWVREHPGSFPPIIINVSDGAATDGDPLVWAERIRTLRTEDGEALLFNLNLSALGGDPMFFPSSAEVLPNDYARQLFEMSSPLPPYMVELASSQGLVVGPGGRGYVYNADMSAVVRFLQIGTATAQAMV